MEKYSDYRIFSKTIDLKGPSMKKFNISPVMIESDLGGIKPKKGQVNYGISMWIKINKPSNKNQSRSIFHNGSRKNHRTPAILIHPDSSLENRTYLQFIHASTIQENDGINLNEFGFELNTWYHWSVSVCVSRIVHYVNGKIVKKGDLKGEAIWPTKDCWLVDPWHGSAEGISISNFCWFPFGISEEFVKSIYLNNPISKEIEKKKKNKKRRNK